MNVTFRLPSEELERRFLAEAEANGLVGLKGHRSVGGVRASLYNAVELEAVEVGVDGVTDGDILVHDETNPVIAHLLITAGPPRLPAAMGVILRRAAEAYDQAFARIPTLENRHWTLLYARGMSLERASPLEPHSASRSPSIGTVRPAVRCGP